MRPSQKDFQVPKESDNLSIQSNDSLSSNYSENNQRQPIALQEDLSRPRTRRQSLIRSITPQSFDSNKISRKISSYSVKDIYGELDENKIGLIRTMSKKSVLRTLSERLDKVDTYKDVPDISVPTKDYGKEFLDIDPEIITWEDDDPNFPRNWDPKQKLFMTILVSLYTLISPMSSSISSPATTAISKDFGITNPTIQALTVSIMLLAFALGPLIIAPLSESDKIGRRVILNASIWILMVFNIGCGFTKSTAQLCVLRFLGGLGGCAALNVGAGTIADLYDDESRNFAMALYSICPTMGPVISPVISGFVVQNLQWRWCFYILSIFNGAVAILGTIFLKETYSPKLLRQKAIFLRKETGNENLHTIFEITGTNLSKFEILKHTILRPIRLLFLHPMILGLGSFMAFTYGFMYLMLVTFPRIYEGSYGFSVGITGLMYVPMGVGYILGIIVWTFTIQKIYLGLTARNGGVAKPEYRLPCLVFSGIGLPVGLILFGWSAEKKLHWIVPSLGTSIFAFSFIAVFQTIQNYLIDMNPRFSASSIAAAAVFRSLFGFSFPLFANQMYDRLGYGWGNTMSGLIGLALGIPFPIFCFKYGESLREWANRKIEGNQQKFDEKALDEEQI
ncbi:polyamine transporter 2 [[Candida] jaroonii]|uniref:Polyamine transporter 2 n=1 Tax=[Candida] jaroonii TaxID=467808 RepID=A0ACA9YEB4_9ASCO|nr:polyamine transporter 2 [[Candida] jaroonii]